MYPILHAAGAASLNNTPPLPVIHEPLASTFPTKKSKIELIQDFIKQPTLSLVADISVPIFALIGSFFLLSSCHYLSSKGQSKNLSSITNPTSDIYATIITLIFIVVIMSIPGVKKETSSILDEMIAYR